MIYKTSPPSIKNLRLRYKKKFSTVGHSNNIIYTYMYWEHLFWLAAKTWGYIELWINIEIATSIILFIYP